MSIAENLNKILSEIPPTVLLVAITKNQSLEASQELYRLNQRQFGENKSKDFLTKLAASPDDVIWHFVGHLQTNKVRKIIHKANLIHSVDSLNLLETIDAEARRENIRQDILLQLRIAQEDTKYGLTEPQLHQLVEALQADKYKNVRPCGIMAMATYTSNQRQVGAEFAKARQVFEQLRPEFPAFHFLSMGMSNDYKIAIEEGSNLIRIGSLLFS